MKRFPLAVVLALALSGCSGGDGGGGGGADCGSAEGTLPAGLETIAWDNGDASENVRAENFEVTVDGQDFALAEEALWEAVRFDLDRPARLHGITVTWTNIDGGAPRSLPVGVFPDFGHNGVDFWRDNPYWTGDRCGSDAEPETPLEYVLDEPVDIDEPGLVYVAHLGELPEDPAFAFDTDATPPGNCALWDDCHSMVNMPEALAETYYQGVSLSFPYDFGVQLHVEWLEDPPAAPVFTNVGLTSLLWHHAAWGDYDADGWIDLLVADRATYPQLLRNSAGTAFVNVTTSAGLGALTYGFAAGGVWGDYDNDGCLDAYYFNFSRDSASTLLHSNCDGTFSDATAAAGPVTGLSPPGDPCTDHAYPIKESAAWIDIDSDALLDLFVTNYNCGGVGSYSFDDNVYRNNGDGTFADWTGTRGFQLEGLDGRGTAPVDFDQDGDVDLLVHNYSLHPNNFYENVGGGNVQEIAFDIGLAGDASPFEGTDYYGHTLGAAWGDLDGDGDFDVVETNLAHPRFFHFSDRTRVLLQDDGLFFDVSGGNSDLPVSFAGIRYRETHTVPVLGDFDNDGDLDLAISQRYSGRPTDFYWGNGDGTFELDPWDAGITVEDGWTMAAGDYDHDGDLDLMTRGGLFRNDLPAPGHWLAVTAVGNVASNRAAIGATVRVIAGGRTFLRFVPGSTGQGAQDSLTLHVGLGALTAVDSIEVDFPAGATTTYTGPFDADQHLRLFEDGTVTAGW